MNRSADSLDTIELAGHVRHSEDHRIATIRGPLPGPTLIALGGIHGNEPAGVLAATRETLSCIMQFERP